MKIWIPYLLHEEKLVQIEKKLDEGEKTLALRLEYACTLFELGQKEKAKDVYLDILAEEPTHFDTLINLGSLVYSMGFRTAAQTAFAEAVKKHPNNPIGHVKLANALRENSELPEARKHYDIALQLDSNLSSAHQGIAYVFMETGEEDKATYHRELGFKNQSISVLPYRGNVPPISLLVLFSAVGGNIPLLHHLDDQIFLTTVLAVEYFDTSLPLPPHHLVFNAVGDADLCQTALRQVENILTLTTGPVINIPSAVRVTGRMDNAGRLSNIPGVITPKTETIKRERLSSQFLSNSDFTFPLLIRRPGFHTGIYFSHIENEQNLNETIKNVPGEELTVIEYLESRNAAGNWRKYRVMFIDGEIYPMHAAISHDWKVHYFTSDMTNNPENREEDAKFLEDMPNTIGLTAMRALKQIQQQLALDYAGIDFGLNDHGDVLLFEANATMVVNPPDRDSQWDYRREPIQRIQNAIRRMLMRRV
jgi:glutathione synthase/RimK-type ligase-like ATP-grasp enzyme